MGVTTRLTYNSAPDIWGPDRIVWPYFFGERTPQSLYLVGDTVHILWTRVGPGIGGTRGTTVQESTAEV